MLKHQPFIPLLGLRRASIKLFTKMMIAPRDVSIIRQTRIIPAESFLPTVPVRGLKSPAKTSRVSVTAICAIRLLPFLNPGVRATSIIPAKTGISAVNEGVSDEKYAQVQRAISTTAFTRLAR